MEPLTYYWSSFPEAAGTAQEGENTKEEKQCVTI